MTKRGPKPSGKALSGAERQRRYQERLKAAARAPSADIECLPVTGFDRLALAALAEAWGTTQTQAAARLLSEAIRREAAKLR